MSQSSVLSHHTASAYVKHPSDSRFVPPKTVYKWFLMRVLTEATGISSFLSLVACAASFVAQHTAIKHEKQTDTYWVLDKEGAQVLSSQVADPGRYQVCVRR